MNCIRNKTKQVYCKDQNAFSLVTIPSPPFPDQILLANSPWPNPKQTTVGLYPTSPSIRPPISLPIAHHHPFPTSSSTLHPRKFVAYRTYARHVNRPFQPPFSLIVEASLPRPGQHVFSFLLAPLNDQRKRMHYQQNNGSTTTVPTVPTVPKSLVRSSRPGAFAFVASRSF